jgi:hypothetical protein
MPVWGQRELHNQYAGQLRGALKEQESLRWIVIAIHCQRFTNLPALRRTQVAVVRQSDPPGTRRVARHVLEGELVSAALRALIGAAAAMVSAQGEPGLVALKLRAREKIWCLPP